MLKLEPLLRIVFAFSLLILVLKLLAYAGAVWFAFDFQWLKTGALILIAEVLNLGGKQFTEMFINLEQAQEKSEEVLAPDFIEKQEFSNN